MDDLRFLDPEALVNRAAFNERFGMLNDLMFGLGNQYLWEKYGKIYSISEQPWSVNGSVAFGQGGMYPVVVQYSASAKNNNGTIELASPIQSITLESYNDHGKLNLLVGNFVFITEQIISVEGNASIIPGTGIYFIEHASGTSNHPVFGNVFLNNPVGYKCIPSEKKDSSVYVNSSSPDAYPPADPDGYTYTALGQVGDKCRVEYGSYLGTGTNGSGNQNELNFSFSPKFGIVHRKSASDSASAFILFVKGVVASQTVAGSTGNTTTNTWMETSVRWYAANAESQMNTNGVEYYYTFLG